MRIKVINPNTTASMTEAIGRAARAVAAAGTEIMAVSPAMGSGGDYGNPLAREPEAVRDDVLDGHISEDFARQHYGVVTENGRLDAAATARLRRGHAD